MMYGRENNYFNRKIPGFQNSVWIELIGFDNEASDFGVQSLIDTMGFVPDMVSFHLTSISFVNTHPGMREEFVLPIYACAYSGHEYNDDRRRQDWTNWQMRELVKSLHRHGIKAYASFFDMDEDPGRGGMERFTDTHPELAVTAADGRFCQWVHMLKRFSDGTFYEDFLLEKLIEVAKDYGLDGIQLADGISSPRMALQNEDYSDDIVKQFLLFSGISLPVGIPETCTDGAQIMMRADYIFRKHRKSWIKFNTGRWAAFMTKIIKGLKANGVEAAFNSAWTKDPLEALFRYGTSYKAYEQAGAAAFIVEDVSADLSILADEENGYNMGYPHRRFVHHEFAANLMQIKAHMPGLPLTPLSMIRDTLEQWDVIHHMPTAMQRAAATNLNNFLVRGDGSFEPVTNGPHFCLGDGLTQTEWHLTRLAWDNGYTEHVHDVPGVTVLWSDARMDAELDALIDKRLWYTGKWLAELLSRGTPAHKIARVEDINAVKGPVLVMNPALLPAEEYNLIKNYRNGPVLLLGAVSDEDFTGSLRLSARNGWGEVRFTGWGVSMDLKREYVGGEQPPAAIGEMLDPEGAVWTHPLDFAAVDGKFVDECAGVIKAICSHPIITEDYGACHVEEVMTSEKTSRLFIENEEYFYALPRVHVGRSIKSLSFLTKPKGYEPRLSGNSFKLRVPGRGMDIVEIEYE
jgi:hypothetical protein